MDDLSADKNDTDPESMFMGFEWRDAWFSGNDEPSSYIIQAEGPIHRFDDNGQNKKTIGYFRVLVVDIGRAVVEGVSEFDVFDSDDRTAEFLGPLVDAQGMPSDAVRSALDSIDALEPPGYLIIDRLELLPEYRGNCTGLTLLKDLVRRFSLGAPIVAAKVFPLQFEVPPRSAEGEMRRSTMALSQYSNNHRDATRKLLRHYSKAGFKRIGRSEFMVALASDVITKQ